MWERFIKLVDKVAGAPFGVASAWKIIAGHPLTRAQAFDLNLHFVLLVIYFVFLVTIRLGGEDIATIAFQGFIAILTFTVISFLVAVLHNRGRKPRP